MLNEYTVLATLAFHHLIIGSLLIVLLAVLNRFLRFSAELKSWLWMTAFIVSTITPFTLISTNDVVPGEFKSAQILSVSSVNSDQPSTVQNQIQSAKDSYWHLPTNIVFSFSYVLTAGLFVWLLGSLWRAIVTLKNVILTRQLINSSLEKIISLSGKIGADVYASAKVSSPMVVGFRKPKVILPISISERLSDTQLHAILLHEYAHIQRKDNWFGMFQELLAILFWWSFVIRFLNRKIHVEREIACDLRAAASLQNEKQYAQSLLDCAKLIVNEQRDLIAMGLFSKKKELSHRVTTVLSNRAGKKPHAFVTAIVCLGLSLFTIQAAQSFSPQISIEQTRAEARHYSVLPYSDGSSLIRAVARNDIETIKILQSEGVDIDTPALGDGTALMIAVKTNNRAMVEGLLALGANVDQSSEGDGNPLIVAAKRNNLALAEFLLDCGADVNAIVPRDETALINATRSGYLGMTQLLLDRGADANLDVKTGWFDDYEIRSPLNQAATTEIKDLLVANGASE